MTPLRRRTMLSTGVAMARVFWIRSQLQPPGDDRLSFGSTMGMKHNPFQSPKQTEGMLADEVRWESSY